MTSEGFPGGYVTFEDVSEFIQNGIWDLRVTGFFESLRVQVISDKVCQKKKQPMLTCIEGL